MAVRKTRSRKKAAAKAPRGGRQGRAPVSMVFLIFCLILLITVFFILLSRVSKTGNISPIQNGAGQTAPPESPAGKGPQPEKAPADKSAEKPLERPREKPAAKSPEQPSTAKPQTGKPPADKAPANKPPEPPPAPPAEKPREKAPADRPSAEKPREKALAEKPPASQAPASKTPAPQMPEKPAETRDRGLYFLREAGTDLQLVKVNRKLNVSETPLVDCLNALLGGPTAGEEQLGLMSFIPSGARIISARVNGNTAVINFNEEFRYNTLGREGSAAQLKQIVWTATEFPNVHNVQIQIEGNIVDFLTEGIAIRNPVGR